MTDPVAPPIQPQVRRPNAVVGTVVGLLVGALLTAMLVGGAEEQVATGERSTGALDSRSATITGAGQATSSGAAAAAPDATVAGDGAGATVAGRDATGGEPGAAGPAAPGGPDCSLLQTEGVRGVTDTSIKIGVGLADLTVLEPVLGEPAKLGPQEEIFEAVLQGMRDEGQLPICGRDIEAVYQRYQVLEESSSRAVCQSFVNDHEVFAVVTSFSFLDPLCVTKENQTFLLDHGLFISQPQMDESGGRLFTLHPPVEVSYEIWTNWAIARHLSAAGAKVGVYYNNSEPDSVRQAEDHIIALLKAAGIQPVVHTTDSGPETVATGDPNDSGAALRFKQEGVTHVMLVNTTLMEAADRQGYRPMYLFKGADAKDSNSGDFIPEHADGAMGIHWDQSNDHARGVPPTAQAEKCMGYAVAAGIPRPREEWAQWNLTMLACDSLGILTYGLGRAGSDLTTDRLVLGLRTLGSWTSHLVGNGGYSESKQWLISENQEARYHGDCACWKNVSTWEPLFYGR